jgi:hypothetical protein
LQNLLKKSDSIIGDLHLSLSGADHDREEEGLKRDTDEENAEAAREKQSRMVSEDAQAKRLGLRPTRSKGAYPTRALGPRREIKMPRPTRIEMGWIQRS